MDSLTHGEHPECKHIEWEKTSYGVGHHHRPGYYFPDAQLKTLTREPLPPLLAKQVELPREQHMQPTTATIHDRKFPNGLYGQTRHNRPPDHWKVTFMKDIVEKLNKPGFRRPLSPSNQLTETQERFKAEPPLPTPETFMPDDKGKHLANKEHPDNTKLIKDDFGKQIPPEHYTMDPSIVKYLDPYITTSHMTHRPFSAGEQRATKDQPTYWNCEDYSKAWGHGPKHNPLPKDSVPRERLPMRDTMVFKDATRIGPLNKKLVHVPHGGLRSEYTGKFEAPSHVNMKYMDNCICPIDPPYQQPRPSAKSAYGYPGMYDTEYNNIGRRKPISI